MTPAPACPDPRDLGHLALGQLPEAEAEQLGQHVLNCSRCAERLQTLQDADPVFAQLREAGAGRLVTDNSTVDALAKFGWIVATPKGDRVYIQLTNAGRAALEGAA